MIFFKVSCKVVLSPPFGLELVIHSIISTSFQEGHPAIKIPLDWGGRNKLDPWALLQNSQSLITALLPSAGSRIAGSGTCPACPASSPSAASPAAASLPLKPWAQGCLWDASDGIFYFWAQTTDGEERTSSIHLLDISSTDLDFSFSSSYSDLFNETEDHYGKYQQHFHQASWSALQELAACEGLKHIEIRDEMFQFYRRDLDAQHPLKWITIPVALNGQSPNCSMRWKPSWLMHGHLSPQHLTSLIFYFQQTWLMMSNETLAHCYPLPAAHWAITCQLHHQGKVMKVPNLFASWRMM